MSSALRECSFAELDAMFDVATRLASAPGDAPNSVDALKMLSDEAVRRFTQMASDAKVLEDAETARRSTQG